MGYYVTGIDVFVWVMLTAGAVIVPMIVLAICCIKQHFKREKSLLKKHYLFQERGSFGNIGPYFSNENVSEKKFKLQPPVIVVNSAMSEKNVRFQEDKSEFPNVNSNELRKTNDYNNPITSIITGVNETSEKPFRDRNNTNNGQSSAINGIKDAINFFITRGDKNRGQELKDNFTEKQPSNRNNDDYESGLPRLANDQTSNASSYRLPSFTTNNQVFQVSNSYLTPPFNTNVSQSPQQIIPENIYSQVVPIKRNQNQAEQSFTSDDQHLYMNSNYLNDRLYGNEPSEKQAYYGELKPQNYGNWNDSSV